LENAMQPAQRRRPRTRRPRYYSVAARKGFFGASWNGRGTQKLAKKIRVWLMVEISRKVQKRRRLPGSLKLNSRTVNHSSMLDSSILSDFCTPYIVGIRQYNSVQHCTVHLQYLPRLCVGQLLPPWRASTCQLNKLIKKRGNLDGCQPPKTSVQQHGLEFLAYMGI
jgi:hypothetical protein